MNLKKSLLLITSFFVVAFSSPFSMAAELTPAGQVILVSGELIGEQPGGESRTLKRGAPFFSNDTLRNVSGDSQIRFTDGTLIALRPSTVMKIDDYKFQVSSDSKGIKVGALNYAVTLVSGGFRSVTGAIAKLSPNDYAVKTNVATIGVRGTDFSLVYNPGSKTCGLAAAMQKGSISLTNKAGVLLIGKDESYNYACVESDSVVPQGVVQRPFIFQSDPAFNFPKGPAHTGGSVCIQ